MPEELNKNQNKPSVTWIWFMIFICERLALLIGVILSLIAWSLIMIVAHKEISIDMLKQTANSWYFLYPSFLLTLLFQMLGIRYGVNYTFSKIHFQMDVLPKIIIWYGLMEFVLAWSQGINLYFAVSLIIGFFWIWYFTRKAIQKHTEVALQNPSS